jgi:hypothetical protein
MNQDDFINKAMQDELSFDAYDSNSHKVPGSQDIVIRCFMPGPFS